MTNMYASFGAYVFLVLAAIGVVTYKGVDFSNPECPPSLVR